MDVLRLMCCCCYLIRLSDLTYVVGFLSGLRSFFIHCSLCTGPARPPFMPHLRELAIARIRTHREAAKLHYMCRFPLNTELLYAQGVLKIRNKKFPLKSVEVLL